MTTDRCVVRVIHVDPLDRDARLRAAYGVLLEAAERYATHHENEPVAGDRPATGSTAARNDRDSTPRAT